MINRQLLNPESIIVVGGSEDISKPGGKILKNILDGGYRGALYVLNPKADKIQGVISFRDPAEMPDVDLAILAIAAKHCPSTVEFLAKKKKTRAFIIISAGFGEENEEGAELERQIVEIVNDTFSCLIGPNCIGFLNQNYHGVFTVPIPEPDPQGVDFISGSGATAVYIMEAGIPNGLSFSNVFSVGNSAQIGVEDVLKHLDEHFDPETSPKIKLLYLESIKDPDMLLKHASSLVRKGCRIAAIKAGSSVAGSRAASSHTGALASSDSAVSALFRKAGIVRCFSREELTSVASVFMHDIPEGKNFAVITHAGGPAVMLTDALSEGGLRVPAIEGTAADSLLAKLFPGSSVSNPIDFMATGTADQLGTIIDACENDFHQINAMVVIFGSPGLFPINNVYDLLHEKILTCKKPIFPVLPSVLNVKEEIKEFLEKGHVNFPYEVAFGRAISRVMNTPAPSEEKIEVPDLDNVTIHKITDKAGSGFLPPEEVSQLLDAAGINRVKEVTVNTLEDGLAEADNLGYPLVMKVIGPVHKSDVGGVVLNVQSSDEVKENFQRMMQIPETTGVLLQPMTSGLELFAGAKKEDNFGHVLLCGIGGIFIEVIKDVVTGLAPLGYQEAVEMIRALKGYKLIKGARGQQGVDEHVFADILVRLSVLVQTAPDIVELDLNPLMGKGDKILAVDARIRIKK